jgi:aminopeptidase N
MALPKLGADRKCREILEDLLDDRDTMLRLDVARALSDLSDPKARPALRDRLEIELDPRVRRRLREALRDLGSEGKRAPEALRDELEKLQAEHSELRGRVAALEARSTPGLTAKSPARAKGGMIRKAAGKKRR